MRKSKLLVFVISLVVLGVMISGCTLFAPKNISLKGTVSDKNGKPVNNAKVTVYDGTKVVRETNTKSDGTYGLILTKKDGYKAKVVYEGYESNMIAIKMGDPAKQDFVLSIALVDLNITIKFANNDGMSEALAGSGKLYLDQDEIPVKDGNAFVHLIGKVADIIYVNPLGKTFVLEDDLDISNDMDKEYTIDMDAEAAYIERFDGTLAEALIVETPSEEGGVKPDTGKLAIENGMFVRTEAGNSSFKLKDVIIGDALVVLKGKLLEQPASGAKGVRVHLRNKEDKWYYGYGFNITSYGYEVALWDGFDTGYIKTSFVNVSNPMVSVDAGLVEIVCKIEGNVATLYRNGEYVNEGTYQGVYDAEGAVNLVLNDMLAIDELRVYNL
mgnify:CR=1 FL=1